LWKEQERWIGMGEVAAQRQSSAGGWKKPHRKIATAFYRFCIAKSHRSSRSAATPGSAGS
jgi:hypothetical protein